MRINMPVTNVEQYLKDGEYIVSKTDLKGRIVYVNRPFLDISGFSEEELMGKAHNIVRHPDMPPEAYADLWRTLQSGLPWRGLVKNRCKNGDFYWVEANANPIWENGKVVGYMSLRTKPTRQQIQAAEALYRRFREGKAQGLTIKEGGVARSGVLGWLGKVANMSIRAQVSLACAIGGAAIFGLGFLRLWELYKRGAAVSEMALAGGLAAAALLAAVWVRWTVGSRVLQPLDAAVRACQSIASGDVKLLKQASHRHEVGRLLHAIYTMAGNIASIVTDVKVASGALSNASEEVSNTARDMGEASNEQAASMEEASSSVQDMSTAISRNTENAKVTDSIAANAAKEAAEGGEAVHSTVGAMQRIAEKVGIIDDIAYQTNLLALNAAIEAARAGEHGKGFAVVAAEVRKLAERSQVAAQEIGELAQSSVNMAERAGGLLDHMVPSIKKTSELVQEISLASTAQSDGVAQINASMGQLNGITQQNAASSQKLAQTAESMHGQAAQLRHLMGFFKLG